MHHVVLTKPCRLWEGRTAGSNARYPVIRLPGAEQKQVYAHRKAYEDNVGPIPDEHEIDHLCRQTLCVEPTHLEPVTHEENRRRARLDVCRAGEHDLTVPENMRFDRNGHRRGCKPCYLRRSRANAAARYARIKGRG